MKSVDEIEHLTIRGSSYVYVRRVPSDMRGIEKRRFIRRAIGKIKKLSLEDARRKVDAMDRDFDACWDSLRCGDADRAAKAYASALHTARLFGFSPAPMSEITQSPDDLQRRLAKLDSVTVPGQPFAEDAARGLLGAVPAEAVERAKREAPPPGGVGFAQQTVSEVFEEDRARSGEKDPKTYETAMTVFIELMGDLVFAEIDETTADDFCLKLATERGNAPGTVEKRRSAFRAVWNRWKRRAKVNRINPWSGVEIADSGGSVDDCLPFHLAHLEIAERAAMSNRAAKTAAQIALLKVTGIGPKELIGLEPNHDLIDGGDGSVAHIWVRENKRRKLKTGEPRSRQIPLVGISIEKARLALLDDDDFNGRVADLLSAPQKNGAALTRKQAVQRVANAIGANIRKALRAAGMPKSRRLVAYSFRHTFKHALRVSKADPWLTDRLMGHVSEKGAAGVYGAQQADLLDLRETVEAAIPLLGHVPLSVYTSDEEMPPKLRAHAEEIARQARRGAMQTIPA